MLQKMLASCCKRNSTSSIAADDTAPSLLLQPSAMTTTLTQCMAARPLAQLHSSAHTALLPLLLFGTAALILAQMLHCCPSPGTPRHVLDTKDTILLPTGTHRCEHHPPDRGHWGCHKGTAARAERPLSLRAGAIWLMYVVMSLTAALAGH